MQAAEIRKVWGAVNRFFRERRSSAAILPKEFVVLCETVRAQNIVQTDDEALLKLITAACALGPGRTHPPEAVIADLRRITAQEPGTGDNPHFDAVVAYGCGKWRTLQHNGDPWHDEWPGAFLTLIRSCQIPVSESLAWLDQHLYGFRKLTSKRYKDPDDKNFTDFVWRDSACLASYLVRPELPVQLTEDMKWTIHFPAVEEGAVLSIEPGGIVEYIPPGAKAVYDVLTPTSLHAHRNSKRNIEQPLPNETRIRILPQDANASIMLPAGISDFKLKPGDSAWIEGPADLSRSSCACGNTNCKTRHRLSAWNPREVSLQSFVSSAVKGPDVDIKLGTFITGMYFPLLCTEGAGESVRLRKALVEFKVCQEASCVRREPPAMYEGKSCTKCGTSFDPATTLRIGIDRLIAVPDVPIYRREGRFHCLGDRLVDGELQTCDNLYETETCPLCGTRPKMRKVTNVWVWVGDSKEYLDEQRMGDPDTMNWPEAAEGDDTGSDTDDPDNDLPPDNDTDEDR